MSNINQLLMDISKKIDREQTILMANQFGEIAKQHPEVSRFINDRIAMAFSVAFETYRDDKHARLVVTSERRYQLEYRPPSLRTIINFFLFDLKQWIKRRTEKLK